MTLVDLDAIREISPYTDEQFREAMKRVLASPGLPPVAASYFPELSWPEFARVAEALPTVEAFQARFIGEALRVMLERTSGGQTFEGIEKLSPRKRYLFLSNHRDILLDSALFTRSSLLAGYGTPKICLGDNLLANALIIDLVKMNKGVTVKRDLSQRELFKWSMVLSEVIRGQIESGTDSVWIAQREGRAKDGNDLTHPGVIKMLSLSGSGNFLERVRSVNIVPVVISYEYDPNDALKARELTLAEAEGGYRKAPGEDVKAMLRGIQGSKGRIHIQVGTEIEAALGEAAKLPVKNDQVRVIAEELDRQIQTSYRLWPSNHAAYEIQENLASSAHCPREKRAELEARMQERLGKLAMPAALMPRLRHHFLQMYANPVRNQLRRTS